MTGLMAILAGAPSLPAHAEESDSLDFVVDDPIEADGGDASAGQADPGEPATASDQTPDPVDPSVSAASDAEPDVIPLSQRSEDAEKRPATRAPSRLIEEIVVTARKREECRQIVATERRPLKPEWWWIAAHPFPTA